MMKKGGENGDMQKIQTNKKAEKASEYESSGHTIKCVLYDRDCIGCLNAKHAISIRTKCAIIAGNALIYKTSPP